MRPPSVCSTGCQRSHRRDLRLRLLMFQHVPHSRLGGPSLLHGGRVEEHLRAVVGHDDAVPELLPQLLLELAFTQGAPEMKEAALVLERRL